jgi:hypothetical protein
VRMVYIFLVLVQLCIAVLLHQRERAEYLKYLLSSPL